MLPLSTQAFYGILIVFLLGPALSVVTGGYLHVLTTNNHGLSMGLGGQEWTQLHPSQSFSQNASSNRVSMLNVGGPFPSVNMQTMYNGIYTGKPSHVIKATNSDNFNAPEELSSSKHELVQELGELLRGHTIIRMGHTNIWNLDTDAALNYECQAFAAEKLEKQVQGKKGKKRKEMLLEGAKLALAKYEINRLLLRKIQMTKILEALEKGLKLGMTPQEVLLKAKFNLTNVQNWVLDLVHVNKETMYKVETTEHNANKIRTMIHSTDGTLVKEFEENERQSFQQSQDEAEEVLNVVVQIVPKCNFTLHWDKEGQTLNGSGN